MVAISDERIDKRVLKRDKNIFVSLLEVIPLSGENISCHPHKQDLGTSYGFLSKFSTSISRLCYMGVP